MPSGVGELGVATRYGIQLGRSAEPRGSFLVIAQLLHLDADNPKVDIRLYANSPGVDMNGLFAIHDTMSFLRADVSTTCIGRAASAAAVLLGAGAPGKRVTLPDARILIHQPHGGLQGQSADIEIWTREWVEMRERMVGILERATGQPRDQLLTEIDRDNVLRGQAAADYGLVDHVIERHPMGSVVDGAAVA